MSKIVIVGTVALDTIETPYGKLDRIIGGSGTHSAMAASFFAPVQIVSVVGNDFPQKHLDFLKGREIDITGIEIKKDEKTFHWEGYYELDMNQAHTRKTELGVLATFDPKVPASYLDSEYLFLGNLDPDIQLKVLKQMPKVKFTVLDSMNFWISSKKEQLLHVISQVDVFLLNDGEARQLTGTSNLVKAAKEILKLGCEYVIIKKGEHGAILFHKNDIFALPSLPLDEVIDPTGAGDSFAGGFIGYLAYTNDISDANLRKAIVAGSTLASFNVQEFSLNRVKTLNPAEIMERFEQFEKLVSFELPAL
jgi:sugar/nucleoside kinase (ribokinase family)